jgi:plastocyanin
MEDVGLCIRPSVAPDAFGMDAVNRPHTLGRTLFLAVLVAAVAGGGCGGDDVARTAPSVTVHMGEFFYRPAELTVARNSALTVVNDGAVVHSWILKGAGVGTAGVAPGGSIIVDLRDIAPGTYAIFCDQPGHTQSGQAGTLIISP